MYPGYTVLTFGLKGVVGEEQRQGVKRGECDSLPETASVSLECLGSQTSTEDTVAWAHKGK